MTIGPYTITRRADGDYHIKDASGEGGVFPAAKVEAMMAKFYGEEF